MGGLGVLGILGVCDGLVVVVVCEWVVWDEVCVWSKNAFHCLLILGWL